MKGSKSSRSFSVPQIRHVMNDHQFADLLVGIENIVWKSLKNAVDNFLGNNRAQIHLVDNIPKAYRTMKCNMVLNIHSLRTHLHFSPPNVGAVSDEYSQKFHKEVAWWNFGKWKNDIRTTGIHQC